MSASKHWERRIPIYLIGMFLMTIGVNLSVLSGIGVSPIDTLPYIVSLIAQKSLGLCTTLVFSVYILLQIVILRRRFQWKNLLQIVLSIFRLICQPVRRTDGSCCRSIHRIPIQFI